MGKIRKWPHTTQVKAQKRSEKTLSLHLRLMNKTSNERQQTLGKSEILISRVTTLSDLNTQFSMNNHKTYKEQEIMATSREKKISRNCPWKSPNGRQIRQTLKQLSERCSKN